MKSNFFGTLAGFAGAVTVSAAPTDRPNIVLFMVDDMGWQDTSVPFDTASTYLNRRYDTPNMERLASMGVKMTSAYACSISSPSRCSLMTGMNQARHRVTNWTLQRDTSTDEPNPYVDMPDWNYNGIQPAPGINNTAVGTSFVELLREAGYHTIHVGKAHFGAEDTPAADPLAYGFDVNIAGHAAGGPATYLSERCFGYNPDGSKWN
ncbi:MAG: sulfatase-like hydrolase/transferase, partial [Paramuribaculum sp.]|nr:sulfatase-like hydrolase/transferase [Paramuribaculum sp.]